MCLHTVDKYEKVETINAPNDYETSKKWTDKKKINLFLKALKFQDNKLKIVQNKF